MNIREILLDTLNFAKLSEATGAAELVAKIKSYEKEAGPLTTPFGIPTEMKKYASGAWFFRHWQESGILLPTYLTAVLDEAVVKQGVAFSSLSDKWYAFSFQNGTAQELLAVAPYLANEN
jgi:hypothetical protein